MFAKLQTSPSVLAQHRRPRKEERPSESEKRMNDSRSMQMFVMLWTRILLRLSLTPCMSVIYINISIYIYIPLSPYIHTHTYTYSLIYANTAFLTFSPEGRGSEPSDQEQSQFLPGARRSQVLCLSVSLPLPLSLPLCIYVVEGNLWKREARLWSCPPDEPVLVRIWRSSQWTMYALSSNVHSALQFSISSLQDGEIAAEWWILKPASRQSRV